MSNQQELVTQARQAISNFLSGTKNSKLVFSKQASQGIFVTLWSKDDSLRGCIGHIEPQKETLGDEIQECAIAAATRDPRFPPVKPEELSKLKIELSLLEPAEKINDISELDPKKYGVIAESGLKRGLLLPGIDGVDGAQHQLSIAMSKGGIGPNEDLNIYRFKVKKISEA